jgi:predicted MarR family transcription regulator
MAAAAAVSACLLRCCRYLFASKMVAGDVYDGLARAAELFVRWPVKRCAASAVLPPLFFDAVRDVYDGLARAAELFVRWPVKRCAASAVLPPLFFDAVRDVYDGLARAAELFVRWPVKRCACRCVLMLA